MMMMVANRGLAVLAGMLIAMAASGWGCLSPAAINPPIVSVTPLGTAARPAKPPDCAMPVLDSMPLTNHQQIALVDAWGDLAAKDEDLLTYLRREGCQVGADAVVLTSKNTQHEGELLSGVAPGRYGSIGPGSEASGQGEHLAADPQGGGKTHHAVVGEVGHSGHFINGIAIVYTKGSGTSSGNQ
jgi:hypothetical protein